MPVKEVDASELLAASGDSPSCETAASGWSDCLYVHSEVATDICMQVTVPLIAARACGVYRFQWDDEPVDSAPD